MNRYVMIDGLRGIGALAIALYHIFRYGPLPEAASQVMPALAEDAISRGWMAVQWFFVIAGLASGLATKDRLPTWSETPRHVARRVIRLGPVYWVSVTLTAILTIVAIHGWGDRSLNDAAPTLWQFTAHLGFVHDLLGFEALTTGIWFVAVILQIDLVFIFLLALARWVDGARDGESRGGELRDSSGQDGGRANHASQSPRTFTLIVCFGPLTLWSLFFSLADSATETWFHHFFCLYMLGVLLGWRMAGRAGERLLWTYFALMGLQLFRHYSLELLNAMVAGLAIYLAWRARRLQTWLKQPVWQYFGRISYSLFMIHYPISWLVGRWGHSLTGDHPWAALAWLLAGLGLSIGAAHLLYIGIERPAVDWARGIGRAPAAPATTTASTTSEATA